MASIALPRADAETGAMVPSPNYATLLSKMPALVPHIEKLQATGTAAETASAVEFLLEGLHLTRRLNRDVIDGGYTYRAERPSAAAAERFESDDLRERLRRRQRRGFGEN